eukprot:ctg_1823.g444
MVEDGAGWGGVGPGRQRGGPWGDNEWKATGTSNGGVMGDASPSSGLVGDNAAAGVSDAEAAAPYSAPLWSFSGWSAAASGGARSADDDPFGNAPSTPRDAVGPQAFHRAAARPGDDGERRADAATTDHPRAFRAADGDQCRAVVRGPGARQRTPGGGQSGGLLPPARQQWQLVEHGQQRRQRQRPPRRLGSGARVSPVGVAFSDAEFRAPTATSATVPPAGPLPDH